MVCGSVSFSCSGVFFLGKRGHFTYQVVYGRFESYLMRFRVAGLSAGHLQFALFRLAEHLEHSPLQLESHSGFMGIAALRPCQSAVDMSSRLVESMVSASSFSSVPCSSNQFRWFCIRSTLMGRNSSAKSILIGVSVFDEAP